MIKSKIELENTKRNLLVARYTLLAASGRLSAIELGLKVENYAPEANYSDVHRRWFGARVDGYVDDLERNALVEDRYFPVRFKK
jgi:outer membrane protein